MNLIRGRFDIDDIAQQAVGGLLVGGPFIVTEEVWVIADQMSLYNILSTLAIVVITGYSISYVAVLRDPNVEATLIGIVPLRLVSLVLISYLSGIIMALSIGAPDVFTETSDIRKMAWITFKAATTISVFTVIGAGTVDSVFGSPVERDGVNSEED